jgi:hypothetical protein
MDCHKNILHYVHREHWRVSYEQKVDICVGRIYYWFLITEVENVCCAVRNDSLNITQVNSICIQIN